MALFALVLPVLSAACDPAMFWSPASPRQFLLNGRMPSPIS